MASDSTKRVSNFSKVRGRENRSFFSVVFIALTSDSQRPPKCGALGGVNFHFIPLDVEMWESD